jgi:hypothetical protein
MNHSFLWATASLAILVGGAGCYSTVDAEPVGYTDTTGAPVDIVTYPSFVYMGQPVYFYGDHWWYRDGARWSYYRSEPVELRGHREAAVRALRARGHTRAEPRVVEPRGEVHEERR